MNNHPLVDQVNELIARHKDLCVSEEARSRIDEVEVYSEGYGEPGYDEGKVVVLGNWNDILRWSTPQKSQIVDTAPSHLAEALELLEGVETQWSDEWVQCSISGQLYRSSPNSYDWQQSYVYIGDDVVGADVLAEREDLLEEFVDSRVGDTISSVTAEVLDQKKLENMGFELILDGLERGYHDGQAADPMIISKQLRKMGVDRFLFKIDYVGQFDVTFSLYVDKKDAERVHEARKHLQINSERSPADCMREALNKAPVAPADGRIHITTIREDGSSTASYTPQEFVEGLGR